MFLKKKELAEENWAWHWQWIKEWNNKESLTDFYGASQLRPLQSKITLFQAECETTGKRKTKTDIFQLFLWLPKHQGHAETFRGAAAQC